MPAIKDTLKEEIDKACEVLKAGGTILYPTDTVWGIGCDATNEAAVSKIFKLKQRAESKSLIVLADSDAMLLRYVREVPPVAWDLIENTDKPLTIIYPDVIGLAPNVIAEDKSAAIRIPQDEFCRQLIYKFRKPIVSTSANISGEATPADFSEISPAILSNVDYVVNSRQNDLRKAQPSTIIKLAVNGVFEIIRK